MGVSGLVSWGSRAAEMILETADQVPSWRSSVVGQHCSVRLRRGPVGSVTTNDIHVIPLPSRSTASCSGNFGGPIDVDTVGVPGDWGYR